MGDLDRALLKNQAKQLIKGRVFKIFIVIFVAGLLTGNSTGINFNTGNIRDTIDNITSDSETSQNDSDYNMPEDEFDFDDFFNEQQNGEVNPIEGFEFDFDEPDENEDYSSAGIFSAFSPLVFVIIAIVAMLALAVNMIFAPLQVTLQGRLVLFIRRDPTAPYDASKEIGAVFRETFNKTYGKKLGLVVLRSIITALLSLLFVIPGIIYFYSTYYAYQIMCDNPKLSPTEALDLSKQMTKDHKAELFTKDLSFIPWSLLVLLSFGIASIYVSPYIQVTNALYYENFRLRAIQTGAMAPYETACEENNSQSLGGNYFYNSACGNNFYNSYMNEYNAFCRQSYYNPTSSCTQENNKSGEYNNEC